MNTILSFLTGLIALALLILKRDENKKNEQKVLKLEVDDAIKTGDLARLNALINHINHRM